MKAPRKAHPEAVAPARGYDVRDYGARADGAADDAPAIQRAIDACAAGNGGEVFIPAGGYLLRSGLRVLDTRPSAPVRLVGEGNASFLYFQREKAGGKVDEAIRLDNATGCGVTGLRLLCERGRGFTHGVHVTQHATPTGPGSTQCVTLDRVQVEGFPIGFGVGTDTDGDVSEVSFRECVASGSETAAFLLGNGVVSNVINVRMFGCNARNSKWGVTTAGCPFTWYGGTAQHNSEWDFLLTGPNTAPVVIDGVRSEHSGGFYCSYGSTQFAMPVSIRSCYVAAWEDPNGVVLDHQSNAPLSVADCVFAMAKTPAVIRLGIGTPNAPGGPGAATFANVGVNASRPLRYGAAYRLTNLGLYEVDGATGRTLGPCDYPAVGERPEPRRAEGKATIERGRTSVVVEHGLGAQPAWEDVRRMVDGMARVEFSGATQKTLTFQTDRPAPARGIEFRWSATLR